VSPGTQQCAHTSSNCLGQSKKGADDDQLKQTDPICGSGFHMLVASH
jgi:hypothetical protein